MATPKILNTSVRWIDSTHLGVTMSWTGGSSGKVDLLLGSTTVLSEQAMTSGTEKSLTYSGIDRNATYTVRFYVTSGSMIAEKYVAIIGDEPVFSLHPSGGAAFGQKAIAHEFHVNYPSTLGDLKVNGEMTTYSGIQGPLVGDGSIIRPNAPRGIITPVPYITYETLNLSAGSTEAQVKTFITAWMEYMASNFTDSNPCAAWIGMCVPGIRCIVQWYPYDTNDLVSGLPRYSVGLLVPFGANNTIYKFGTDNGTVFFNSI